MERRGQRDQKDQMPDAPPQPLPESAQLLDAAGRASHPRPLQHASQRLPTGLAGLLANNPNVPLRNAPSVNHSSAPAPRCLSDAL
jgi:hypothetical protein